MERIPLSWSCDLDAAKLAAAVSQVATELDLTPDAPTTLKTLPGSLHWHVRKRGENGVLEVTLLPDRKSGSVSVHDNRSAPWIGTVIDAVVNRLDEELKKRCKPDKVES